MRRAYFFLFVFCGLLLFSCPFVLAAGLVQSTIPCATTSTAVFSAAPFRSLLILQNDSDTVIYVSLTGVAATVGAGVRLEANGGSLFFDLPTSMPRAAITCIHGGSGTKNLLATEIN